VENGVQVALLVDPDDESILVFRAGANPHAVSGAERVDVTDVLPGFELTAEQLFASLRA
jgi:Uma2 family endonuclease